MWEWENGRMGINRMGLVLWDRINLCYVVYLRISLSVFFCCQCPMCG
jgi:hypothetical protein